MLFNKHSDLRDKHAFLSPSNYHWLHYDDAKLERVFNNVMTKERGTALHKLACDCINLGVRLPDIEQTLNMYVNDAIGFRMIPEQVLYYSENCFGTADTISYRDNLLRIHDLKNGEHKAYMHQLEVYAAIFFLEYGVPLDETEIKLRIYQSNNVWEHVPDKKVISNTMAKIVHFDREIKRFKGEDYQWKRKST